VQSFGRKLDPFFGVITIFSAASFTCQHQMKRNRKLVNEPTTFIQGCQIFLGTTCQSGGKFDKFPRNIPNDQEAYQMAVNYFKWPQNKPTLSIPKPSKICPNLPKLGFFGLKMYHLATLLSFVLAESMFYLHTHGLVS
jgi:hypothetical protein